MHCNDCGAEIANLPCGACLLSLGLESPAAPVPEIYGPYQIIRRLGEGGMGAVYLAEQLAPIHRQVALKIIKPGMDSSEVLSRFTYERQALALMDHPNIAHVFEAGATPSGLPFFVMEFIDGEPITTYCDRHNLTTRARLHLFLQVCQALRHAHQKGVIHRDIKPSNILVTEIAGQPVPKVIDFGIARAVNLPPRKPPSPNSASSSAPPNT